MPDAILGPIVGVVVLLVGTALARRAPGLPAQAVLGALSGLVGLLLVLLVVRTSDKAVQLAAVSAFMLALGLTAMAQAAIRRSHRKPD
jgi:hypothetical protein